MSGARKPSYPPPVPPKIPSPPPVMTSSWSESAQRQPYGYGHADPHGTPGSPLQKVADNVTLSDVGSLPAHGTPGSDIGQPRRKVRILSLDGGGIRGYSTLVILTELMHVLHVQLYGRPPSHPSQLPKPADYFDLIGGNGTGGLIALMLGRMRMGVEECMKWYVELTKFVFITDKTVLGVPYGKTMFKKERLEQAIKICVADATRHDNEPIIPPSIFVSPDYTRRGSDVRSSVSAATGSAAFQRPNSALARHNSSQSGSTRRPIAITSTTNLNPRGDSNALLRDSREGATKTFVTTTYKGSTKGSAPVLLRTYPSRVESDPCPNATIWEAGRATCATLSAFKPITIEQNTFLDEGFGKYNPSESVLGEAVDNEFSDCEVGVFISIGTGKRPGRGVVEEEKPKWWEDVVSSPFQNWTDARKRLIRKLADSERVHRKMIGEETGKSGPGLLEEKGVKKEDYYRLNVEVGVGEYAMNEWNRLAEVSTGTRRYLHEKKTKRMILDSTAKLATIEKEYRASQPSKYASLEPPSNVAELSAEIEEDYHSWSPTQTSLNPSPQLCPYGSPPPQQNNTITSWAQGIHPPPPQHIPQEEDLPAPLRITKRRTDSNPMGGVGHGMSGPPHVAPPVPPIIRVTSPTVKGGDSDDEDERRPLGRGGRVPPPGTGAGRGGQGWRAPYPIYE